MQRYSVTSACLAAALLATAGARAAERVLLAPVAPVATLAAEVAGPRARVLTLVPPGASPETWEPTPRQLRAVAGAGLMLVVGLPAERTWLARLAGAATEVVDCDPRVPRPADAEPHPWGSPEGGLAIARCAAAALIASDPSGGDGYRRRLQGLAGRIRALDAELAAMLHGRRRRAFLVYHPAWGEFALRYGLEQVAIERGGRPPTPGLLARIVERARAQGMRTVFASPTHSLAPARAVARLIGGRVVVLDPLAADYLPNLARVGRAIAEALDE